MKHYEFWFVVGSQTLYGDDVLTTVANRAEEMAQKLSAVLPYPLKYKVTAKSSAEITQVVKEANYDDNCAGIVTWCHTFSPSKMWINGLDLLQKPWLHFATQYNREIPNEEIDMDFMNLNQAAHGDREHGFIGARLRKPRKVIAGYWQDADVQARIGSWMKAAIGVAVSKDMKVMRFGDNMRNVAVTEGDKVEVQKKLGWEVNTWAVGDLVKEMNAVTEAEIDALMDVYREKYDFATDDIAAIRYQAREEIAMKKMMDAEGCKAFSNTFQDLYGMEQLPGLASQHLMAQGYGYGGEGDWKVAAMTAILKAMGENGNGASAFMEDYTYHLVKGQEYSLGAHMLEVCPSVAAGRPRIETHFLGIGMNEKDPARLVFEGKPGKAVVVSLIDMGGRLRLIVQDIEAVKPIDHADAEPARRPRDVEGHAEPHHRRRVLDHRRRRTPHRPQLRRHRRAAPRLGPHDGDRIRPHHQRHHRRIPGARTLPQRPRVEAEITPDRPSQRGGLLFLPAEAAAKASAPAVFLRKNTREKEKNADLRLHFRKISGWCCKMKTQQLRPRVLVSYVRGPYVYAAGSVKKQEELP